MARGRAEAATASLGSSARAWAEAKVVRSSTRACGSLMRMRTSGNGGPTVNGRIFWAQTKSSDRGHQQGAHLALGHHLAGAAQLHQGGSASGDQRAVLLQERGAG